MTKWEYSSLLASLTWQRQTPGDESTPWAAPLTTVAFTGPDDVVTPMTGTPIRALNELGGQGWEVYAVDTDKALFDANATTPLKSSSWVRRTYYLKRER